MSEENTNQPSAAHVIAGEAQQQSFLERHSLDAIIARAEAGRPQLSEAQRKNIQLTVDRAVAGPPKPTEEQEKKIRERAGEIVRRAATVRRKPEVDFETVARAEFYRILPRVMMSLADDKSEGALRNMQRAVPVVAALSDAGAENITVEKGYGKGHCTISAQFGPRTFSITTRENASNAREIIAVVNNTHGHESHPGKNFTLPGPLDQFSALLKEIADLPPPETAVSVQQTNIAGLY